MDKTPPPPIRLPRKHNEHGGLLKKLVGGLGKSAENLGRYPLDPTIESGLTDPQALREPDKDQADARGRREEKQARRIRIVPPPPPKAEKLHRSR